MVWVHDSDALSIVEASVALLLQTVLNLGCMCRMSFMKPCNDLVVELPHICCIQG